MSNKYATHLDGVTKVHNLRHWQQNNKRFLYLALTWDFISFADGDEEKNNRLRQRTR